MALKNDSRREIIIDSIICLAVAVVLLFLAAFRVFAAADNIIYDKFLNFRLGRPETAAENSIIILSIDEESLAEINQRWPWDRGLYARTIDFLHKSEAKAVGIDLLFIEPSKKSSQDEILARAMKEAANVVIAAKLERITRSIDSDEVEFTGSRLVMPLGIFRDVADAGLVNLEYSTGSVVRNFKYSYDWADEKIPSFALQVYRKVFGIDCQNVGENNRLIDYQGADNTFTRIPIYQVINRMLDRRIFKDKIVLIGATFTDAHDYFATPFAPSSRPCAGVEIQANILSTMIENSALSLMPVLPQLFIIFALVAVAGYLAMFRSARMFWLMLSVVMLVLCVFEFFIVTQWRMFMDLSYSFLSLPLIFFLVSMRMRKPLIIDTKVGPYVLLEELGQGGMAVVYRALHPKSKEEVALKRLLPQFVQDEESLQRFVRETELIRQLEHPNIIRIVDAGDIGGCPYYAMELIKGSGVDEVIKEQKRISPEEVRRIGSAVARALACAHEAGVIHRDIKPSNIMLTSTGVPKLTDFGIARKENHSELTRTGMIVGTPDYIAPEVCKGVKISFSTDIYSLGATLYTMLSGRKLFSADDVYGQLAMIQNEKPVDIRNLVLDVDEDLAKLVMQCLEKSPEDRPPDMMTVAKILDPFYTDIAMRSTVLTGSYGSPDAGEGKTTRIERSTNSGTTIIDSNS